MYYWKIRDFEKFQKNYSNFGFMFVFAYHNYVEKQIDETHKIRIYMHEKSCQRIWLETSLSETKGYGTCVGAEVEPFIQDFIKCGEVIKEEKGE